MQANTTNIVSSTDSKEDVAKAQAMYSKEPKKETKPAPKTEKVEAKTTEAPEALENEVTDAEELETDDVDQTEEQQATAEDAKPKKKGGFQKRIDKLNKAKSLAEQEAAHWRERYLANENKTTEKKEVVAAEKPKTASDGKPDPEQYKNAAEYFEALTDWKVDQKEKAREFQAKAAQAKTEQEKTLSGFRERTKEFKKTVTDFDDVLADVDHIPLSAAMQDLFVSSDHGHQLLYELAKDPAEYERVTKMSPLQAARELGKREAKLSVKASEEPIETKTTKAPPPIKPVGKASTVSTKDPGEMSYRDYVEWHKRTGGRTR